MTTHGEAMWNELNTTEPDKAKAFYAEVLGWEVMDGPMPGGGGRYLVGKAGDKLLGGIMPLSSDMAMMPTRWWRALRGSPATPSSTISRTATGPTARACAG